MDCHTEKDRQYHADIAEIYDYITNEPREYPNELLFRPIDRCIKRPGTMLDLGCGTGQMLFRYGHMASNAIAVDHSSAMLRQARRKANARGWQHITWVERDIEEFLKLNRQLRPNLVTCVGVLHHLNGSALQSFMKSVSAILSGGGQLLVAEPVVTSNVPQIVRSRNARSTLVARLAECMPPGVVDPDEEPLDEQLLVKSMLQAGLKVRIQTRGFELFHVKNPITVIEKLIIRYIYWRYRRLGDVVAILGEKQRARS